MLGDEHWAIKNESTEATFWWSVQSKSWSVTGLAHQIAELLNTWNNPTTCQKLWSGLGDKHTLRAYSWACPWIQSPDNICRPLGSGQAADNVLWKAGPRKQGCHNLLRREAGCSSVSSWRSEVDIWLLSDFPIQRQDFFFFFFWHGFLLPLLLCNWPSVETWALPLLPTAFSSSGSRASHGGCDERRPLPSVCCPLWLMVLHPQLQENHVQVRLGPPSASLFHGLLTKNSFLPAHDRYPPDISEGTTWLGDEGTHLLL